MVTGAETANGTGLFTVTSAAATITTLNPASGTPGQTLTAVAITGSGTHFTQATPAVTFSKTGLTASAITVIDNTHLTATITIALSATAGASNVMVVTGAETATGAALFTVTTASPIITTLAPASGTQGQTLTAFAITGTGTHFTQATPVITFSNTGVTASAISVVDNTHLTATIKIATAALGASNITVVTGAETASGAGLFTVTAGLPAILTFAPSSGLQGQTLTAVAISGAFTHFTQATPAITFSKTGIAASAISVVDDTHLTATVTIAASASLGPSNVTVVTGPETAAGTALFNIGTGAPIITTLVPATGQQGQVLTAVAITGSFTHFTQATPTLSFNTTGITPSAISVVDNTHLTATLTIAPSATPGATNITVTTGPEIAISTGVFTVTTGSPMITTLSPATGLQGQTLTGVTITGSLTHFTQATPAIVFSSIGVAASAISVVDNTHLTATISVAPTAALGSSNITVTTGAETASGTGVFTVTAGTPILTTINPASGLQGQTLTAVAITGAYTHFTQSTPVLNFSNTGTIATAISVLDDTHLTATLTITAAASSGVFSVTVTTGTEIAIGAGLFTVTANPPVITSLTPTTIQQGQQGIPFAIAGQFTHFAQANTTADFGPGITVASLTVNSATSATALLNIPLTAAIGPRTLTLTTGTEIVDSGQRAHSHGRASLHHDHSARQPDLHQHHAHHRERHRQRPHCRRGHQRTHRHYCQRRIQPCRSRWQKARTFSPLPRPPRRAPREPPAFR